MTVVSDLELADGTYVIIGFLGAGVAVPTVEIEPVCGITVGLVLGRRPVI